MIDDSNRHVDVDDLMRKIRDELGKRTAHRSSNGSVANASLSVGYRINEHRFSTIDGLLRAAAKFSEPRSAWPARAARYRIPLAVQKTALKTLSFLFRDQRNVNQTVVSSAREMLTLQLEGTEAIRELVRGFAELAATVGENRRALAAVEERLESIERDLGTLKRAADAQSSDFATSVREQRDALDASERSLREKVLELSERMRGVEIGTTIAEIGSLRLDALEPKVDAIAETLREQQPRLESALGDVTALQYALSEAIARFAPLETTLAQAVPRHEFDEARTAFRTLLAEIEPGGNLLSQFENLRARVDQMEHEAFDARLAAKKSPAILQSDLEANELSLLQLRDVLREVAVHGSVLATLMEQSARATEVQAISKYVDALPAELTRIHDQLDAFVKARADGSASAAERAIVADLSSELRALDRRVASASNANEQRFTIADLRSATIDQRFANFEPRLAAQEERLSQSRLKNEAVHAEVAELTRMLPRLERNENVVARLSETLTGLSSDTIDVDEATMLQVADSFRGSEEIVVERLSTYLPRLEPLQLSRSSVLVDLGAGRGEWLTLMQSRGYKPLGVDTSSTLIERLRGKGFEAHQSDALDYLRGLGDNSVSLVTAFHLIEHVSFSYADHLLREISRALRPGGMMILETPNPANVLTGSCNFYLDPTHRRPIPSQLLRLQCESKGLVDIDVLQLHPNSEGMVPGNSALVNQFNEFFHGAMDYAIIARAA